MPDRPWNDQQEHAGENWDFVFVGLVVCWGIGAMVLGRTDFIPATLVGLALDWCTKLAIVGSWRTWRTRHPPTPWAAEHHDRWLRRRQRLDRTLPWRRRRIRLAHRLEEIERPAREGFDRELRRLAERGELDGEVYRHLVDRHRRWRDQLWRERRRWWHPRPK